MGAPAGQLDSLRTERCPAVPAASRRSTIRRRAVWRRAVRRRAVWRRAVRRRAVWRRAVRRRAVWRRAVGGAAAVGA
ncbi:hypothetical protein O7626_06110 [Micromonospora sp. WMMD1102]|uniref:hypothetical protein n=1 Tax=Micromonospora sp. WMMD1102 TaxID=3016105 RepID=UPI0024152E77|nr:hypothetical protein [Micromonospora sp. WMMD1102]MDG4785510.1 hypothetical protein [Micromonospora sp. WMMD1102]